MTLPEILKQLPETDREIQAKEPPPKTPEEQKRRRRDEYPESWGKASKVTGPEPGLARKLAGEVFAGGRDQIIGLIRLLDAPVDYKPEYLLHCMAILGTEKDQRLLVKTIASQLEKSNARSILIRELQSVGSEDAIQALGKYLADDKLCDDAARALTAIDSSGARAQFRKAFSKSTGKCRIIIAQNLGALRDSKAVDLLRGALRQNDAELGSVAAWGLARLGDAQSADALIKAADSAQGQPRAKATGHVLLLAETLAMQGKKTEAARIYNHLVNTRTDPSEKYIRDAAAKHLTVFML
jgi:hypothetical protein